MDAIATEIAWACGVRIRKLNDPVRDPPVERYVVHLRDGTLVRHDSTEHQAHAIDGTTVVRLAQFAWESYKRLKAERTAAGESPYPAAQREQLESTVFPEVQRLLTADDPHCRRVTTILVEETMRRGSDVRT